MHQVCNLCDPVVMQEDTREGPSAILIFVLFVVERGSRPLIANEGIEEVLNIGVISDVIG